MGVAPGCRLMNQGVLQDRFGFGMVALLAERLAKETPCQGGDAGF